MAYLSFISTCYAKSEKGLQLFKINNNSLPSDLESQEKEHFMEKITIYFWDLLLKGFPVYF